LGFAKVILLAFVVDCGSPSWHVHKLWAVHLVIHGGTITES